MCALSSLTNWEKVLVHSSGLCIQKQSLKFYKIIHFIVGKSYLLKKYRDLYLLYKYLSRKLSSFCLQRQTSLSVSRNIITRTVRGCLSLMAGKCWLRRNTFLSSDKSKSIYGFFVSLNLHKELHFARRRRRSKKRPFLGVIYNTSVGRRSFGTENGLDSSRHWLLIITLDQTLTYITV